MKLNYIDSLWEKTEKSVINSSYYKLTFIIHALHNCVANALVQQTLAGLASLSVTQFII
jgi:hypothetical protein